MSDKSSRPLVALLFAALTVAARLPFLVSHKIPFDSDEAVEGLMARHVLNGELPAFLWGQAFKGVPEVYAAAGVFAVFGSSVTALKSVTLACFSAYVALNFALLDRIASRWVAAVASLLLIASPPALVFWSLDASAEYVFIMLLGTLLLLLCEKEPARQRSPAPGKRLPERFFIGLVIGAGLWVHQLFVVYLVPLALVAAARSDWRQREPFRKPRAAVLVLLALAAIYVALALIAFLTGGVSFHLGPWPVGVRAPQKMLRIAAAIAVLAALAHVLANTRREGVRAFARCHWPAAAGFAIGYSPVLVYSALVEPARSPARNANLEQLLAAAPDIFGNIVPILAGFKIATTERLAVPAAAAIPAAAAVAAYVWSSRHRLTRDFFALFVVFVPLLFLVSGAYIDTQSYRYLIPWYAGLAVAWAVGSTILAQRLRATHKLAALVAGSIIAVHLWQQALWYRKLQPDTQSRAALECLERNGIRGGLAEYWTAYKLTFLSGEAIIFAPTDGIDRYPAYTDFVRSLPAAERRNATRCLLDPHFRISAESASSP